MSDCKHEADHDDQRCRLCGERLVGLDRQAAVQFYHRRIKIAPVAGPSSVTGRVVRAEPETWRDRPPML